MKKVENFPQEIRGNIIPTPKGKMNYRCVGCDQTFGIDQLLYVCPECKNVLLLENENFYLLKSFSGEYWRELFDYRRMLNIPALSGVFRYYELIAPVIPIQDIVYLGEGNTPIVQANKALRQMIGVNFYYKNDGQNPSASFKDRGMASALSFINYLVKSGIISDVLAICASTGDTSASAAQYASYLQPTVKSAVLLPHKKVTPQQLSQPLGSGAKVFEIPGVFDDCMKVVEYLAEYYNVALLNSKNAWRILGQESYAFEVAQVFEYELDGIVVFVPIGNAGNITALLGGFMKLYQLKIIDQLPKIVGVQSEHADPVFRYYQQSESERVWQPVTVKPSVAQAAMIGDPVSMPRVIMLEKKYNELAGEKRIHVVEVSEQDIMDSQLLANRNGHSVCTHGGECLAGLRVALEDGIVMPEEVAVLDSTAHAIKFSGFQDKYFENTLSPEYEIVQNPELVNLPRLIHPKGLTKVPEQGKPLKGKNMDIFVKQTADEVAELLDLKKRQFCNPEG